MGAEMCIRDSSLSSQPERVDVYGCKSERLQGRKLKFLLTTGKMEAVETFIFHAAHQTRARVRHTLAEKNIRTEKLRIVRSPTLKLLAMFDAGNGASTICLLLSVIFLASNS